MFRKYLTLICFFIANTYLYSQSTFNSAGFCFAPEEQPSTNGGFWSKTVVKDFDGDGKLDFMGLHYSNNDVEVYKNTGGTLPTFTIDYTTPIPNPNSFNGVDFAVSDFDGDGKLDYAMIDTSFNVALYKNTSTIGNINFTYLSSFNASITGLTPSWPAVHLEAGDFNLDGQNDLVEIVYDQNGSIGNIGAKVKIIKGLGSFAFDNSTPVFTAFNGKIINISTGGYLDYDIKDLNGDGKNDFVISYHNFSANDTISILQNLSTSSTFSLLENKMKVTGNPVNYIKNVYIKDLNNDSNQDIVCYIQNSSGMPELKFHYGTTTPFTYSTTVNSFTLPVGYNCEYFEIDDLNNDGKNELIGRNSYNSPVMFKGKSNTAPYFDTVPLNIPYYTGPQFVNLADFTGNGYKDIILNPGVADGGESSLIFISNNSYSLNITPVSPAFCVGDSVKLVATTNYTPSVSIMWNATGPFGSSHYVTSSGNNWASYNILFGTLSCVIKSDTVNVISNVLPTIFSSSNGTTACSSSPLTLNVVGASTYTWQPGNLTGAAPTVNLPSSSYTVVGEDMNGCKTTSVVSINIIPSPTLVINTSTNTICQGTTAILTPSGAVNYTLQPGNSTGSSFTVNPLLNTTYTITGTGTNACSNSETTLINVNPAPSIGISPSTATICNGQSITAVASGGINYIWYPGGAIGVSQSFSPSASTTYSVIGNNSFGCYNFNTINITVVTTPTVIAVASINTVCVGEVANLSASGATNYTWNPGGYTGASVGINVTTNTTFTVTGELIAGCSDSNILNIDVWPSTFTTGISGYSVCAGQTIEMFASGAVTYSWSNGSSASSITVEPLGPELYILDAVDSYGCKYNQQFSVDVDAGCQVIVFNGLTPNGDNVNDYLFIKNIDQYPNNNVKIFNRWGQLLFDINSYDNKGRVWRGTLIDDSKLAPSGTYYYVIDLNKGKDLIKGYIELTQK